MVLQVLSQQFLTKIKQTKDKTQNHANKHDDILFLLVLKLQWDHGAGTEQGFYVHMDIKTIDTIWWVLPDLLPG